MEIDCRHLVSPITFRKFLSKGKHISANVADDKFHADNSTIKKTANGCIAFIDDIQRISDDNKDCISYNSKHQLRVKIHEKGGNRSYIDNSRECMVEVHQNEDDCSKNDSESKDVLVDSDIELENESDSLQNPVNDKGVEKDVVTEEPVEINDSLEHESTPTQESVNHVEYSVETIYAPGDMIWVKVSSYPFWPCMVAYPPKLDASYKKKVKKNGKHFTIYHVQYFGEKPQRGWTPGGNILPYKGKKQFLDLCSKFGHSKRFKINEDWQKSWNLAVEEAEVAFEYEDIDERLEDYSFDYGIKRKRSVKRVTKGSSEDEENSSRNSASVKKSKPSKDPDLFCFECGKKDPEISCSGECQSSFHLRCIKQGNSSSNFKCDECLSTESQPCFACKEKEGIVVKCSKSKCMRNYHLDCLNELECSNKDKFVCPLHTCITCFRDNPNNKMCHKGSLTVCIRCPTAFHSREACIAAGSKEISSTTLICPYHFVFRKKSVFFNLNTCTSCGKGGELVCCETCPNAFHESCLENGIPTGDFLCEDCLSRRHLLNSMIVWTRFAKYRWWPAKIIPYSQLPDNVKNFDHVPGEFAVRFFGAGNYAWVHSKCTFPYDEVHKEVDAGNTTKEGYKKSLIEAAQAYDEYLALKASKKVSFPDPYKSISTNRARPPAVIATTDVRSLMQCSCDPSKDNPCGFDSECLNRNTYVECHPDVCKAGKNCQNRQFVSKVYAATKMFKTQECGWGLAADEDISKGKFVIEYVGEVITHEEYKKRSVISQSNYYFLHLDAQRLIDAGPMGNLSRFINHSCNPNCVMEKWSVNGDARIGIFALMDIPKGTELTFNYQSEKYEFEQKCLCRAENCKGFIGRKTQAQNIDKRGAKKPFKRLKVHSASSLNSEETLIINESIYTKLFPNLSSDFLQSDAWNPYVKLTPLDLEKYCINFPKSLAVSKRRKKSNDDCEAQCFICKKTGTLILCDKRECIRAYHVSCVDLPPTQGKWICPCHQCKICNKEADGVFCNNCPTSFCKKCWTYKVPSRFLCQLCKIRKRAKL